MSANNAVETISFWKNSITRRYFLISLLIATLPLMLVTWSYDRFTGQLLDNLGEQKVQHSINSSFLEVGGFLRDRQYQLGAVIDLPNIEWLLETETLGQVPDSIYTLINFETDSPHIYGVLFFDRDWNLRRALPGQGAAGFPYAGEGVLDIRSLPKVKLGDYLLIGPQLPSLGYSGWFLLVHPLNPPELDRPSPGYAALQLRLASVTEQLKPLTLIDGFKPLLITPGGQAFSLLGEPVDVAGELLVQKKVAPGWAIQVRKVGNLTRFTEEVTRPLFLVGVALSILLVIVFFLTMTYRVKNRIVPLIRGADAIAKGNWNYRITPTGNDEITLLAKTFNSMGTQLQELIDSRIEVEKKAVMGEFSAGVAHEIRNPLATMKICVQSLPVQHDARAQEMLAMMQEEIDRVNEVIEDLLRYARPMEPKRQRVQAGALFQRAQSLAGPLAAKHKVELSVEGDLNVELNVDENQLQQVLMNLMLNAIQAMPEGGRLWLKARRLPYQVVLQVKDTGAGMSAEQLDKATQPFFTTKPKGTGLGLAISARLVQLNRGRLSIESAPGQGTTVHLRFDRA